MFYSIKELKRVDGGSASKDLAKLAGPIGQEPHIVRTSRTRVFTVSGSVMVDTVTRHTIKSRHDGCSHLQLRATKEGGHN